MSNSDYKGWNVAIIIGNGAFRIWVGKSKKTGRSNNIGIRIREEKFPGSVDLESTIKQLVEEIEGLVKKRLPWCTWEKSAKNPVRLISALYPVYNIAQWDRASDQALQDNLDVTQFNSFPHNNMTKGEMFLYSQSLLLILFLPSCVSLLYTLHKTDYHCRSEQIRGLKWHLDRKGWYSSVTTCPQTSHTRGDVWSRESRSQPPDRLTSASCRDR